MLELKTLALAVMLLTPDRAYFQPGHPIPVTLEAAALKQAVEKAGASLERPMSLALVTPQGRVRATAPINPASPNLDLAAMFPGRGGETGGVWDGQTYYAQVLVGETPVGTPLRIIPLKSPALRGRGPGKPDALRIEPEQLVYFDTTEGRITMQMSPEAAPNTVVHFQQLAKDGFYTNIPFHRIIPEFVIQGGDPTGTGTGGPGYHLDLESSEKLHQVGTLSMARSRDLNSAGSQFFICLSRENCAGLDQKYTAFGDVVSGMDVVKKIAATPLADRQAGRPVNPPMIKSSGLTPAPPRQIVSD